MPVHIEPNATLLGRKILVAYSSLKRKPTIIATKGRHNAQCMIVQGTDEVPAYAVIDVKLHYIKER